MKRNQVTAILLSVIMTISTCMPGNVISALAAENAGTQSTEAAAAVEEPADETEAPVQEEMDAESLPGSGEDEAEKQDEKDASEAVAQDEAADAADEADAADAADTADETDAAVTDAADEAEPEEDDAQEAEAPEEVHAQEAEEEDETDSFETEEQEEILDETAPEQTVSLEAKSNDFDNNLYVYPEGGGGNRKEIYAYAGEPVTLRVVVSANDTSQLQYEWARKEKFEEEDYTYWGYRTIEGEDTEEYTIPALTETSDYMCIVRDQYGNQGEVYFNVFIDNDLIVIPEGAEDDSDTAYISIDPGSVLTLRAIVSANDTSQLEYTWEYYDADANVYVTIEGENASEYTISNVTASRLYVLIAKDQYKNIGTAYFNVTVNNALTAYPEGVEYEGSDTAYISVDAGAPVTLRVIADAYDTSQLRYEWSYSEERMTPYGYTEEVYVAIEGEESAEYTIPAVMGHGKYRSIVRDQYGNSKEAYFEVWVDNDLTITPEGAEYEGADFAYVYVNPGGDTTLRVNVNAKDMTQLQYEWKSSQQYYDEDFEEYFWRYETIEGAVTDAYEVLGVTEPQSFLCIVSDQYGNTGEARFYTRIDNDLTVYPEGAEDEEDSSVYVYVNPGEAVTLRTIANACDTSDLRYTWYRYGERTDEDGDTWGYYTEIEGADTAEYTISSVILSEEYKCVVEDQYGSSRSAFFYVKVDTDLTLDRVGYYRKGVAPGGEVTLQVEASAKDGVELHYHWYLDDEEDEWEPEGQGTDTITFEVQQSDYVYCKVRDDYGNSESTYYYVYIDNQFDVYPEGASGQYNDEAYLYVSAGSPLTLKVIVSAADPSGMRYEWTRYQRYEYTDSWETVEEFETESPEYSIASVTKAARYGCTVYDKYGNSDYVDFYVYVQTHLDVNRVGDYYKYVGPGEAVTLQVQATADDGVAIDYYWYSENDWSWEPQGLGTASVTFVPKESGYYYYCTVRDEYGNQEIVDFVVAIDNQLMAYPEGAESEAVNDAYFNVSASSQLTLRTIVSAIDTSEVQYQWYRHRKVTDDYGDSWWTYSSIDGANTAEYSIASVAKSEQYRCTVSDQYGNERSVYFYITVETHLEVKQIGDSDRNISPGEAVTLQVQATADDGVEIYYNWYQREYEYYEWSLIGSGSDTITVTPQDSNGDYYCEVTDEYSNSKSVYFYIHVDNQLKAWPDGKGEEESYAKIEPVYGEPVTLKVNVSAIDTSRLSYSWYVDGDWIDDADTSEYVIEAATTSHTYRCYVRDQYDGDDNVTFDVVFENHLKAYPEGHRNKDYLELKAAPHASVTLNVVAEADDISQLTYEWTREDTGNGYHYYGTIEGADTGTYTITSLEHNSYYECRVTDQFGNSKEVSFKVLVDNGFVAYPEGGQEDDDRIYVYVTYGQPVTLRVVASALEEDSLTYKWRDDDNNTVTGATGKECTVSSVKRELNYRCVVSDPYGNQKYIYFYLHVENHLNVYPEGFEGRDTAYLYVKPGTQVTLHTVIEADDQDNMEISWYREDEWESGLPHQDTITVSAKHAEYGCYVSDKYGNSKSVYFVIRVENGFIAYPEGAEMDQNGQYLKEVHLYPAAGEELDLTAIASSDKGILRYFWYRSKNYATSWGEYESDYVAMPEDVVAETRHVTATKTTSYYCEVRDEYGNSEEVYFYIHVGGIYAYPEGNEDTQNNRISVLAQKDEEKTLRVIAGGAEDAQLTYKWTEGPLNDSGWWPFEQGEGSTTNELVIHPDSSRRYLCVVTDQYDNQAFAYFYVNVNGMTVSTNKGTPKLTGDNRYEVTVNAAVGESVTLETTAETEQTDPLYYTWEYCHPKWDRTEMTGENSNSITVTAGESKFYVNTIEDESGNVVEVWYNFVVDNQFEVYPEGASAGTDWVDIYTQPGEQLSLKPVVSGTDLTEITYQWEDSSGRDLGYYEDLPINVIREETYSCCVEDRFGNEKTVWFHLTFSEKKDLKNAVITLSPSTYTYDGTAKTPAVTVTYQNTELTGGTDYTVAYSNNVNAGQAKVTITAAGEYVGSKEKTFTIQKADQTLTVPHNELTIEAGNYEMVGATGNVTALSYSSSNESVATVDTSGKITAVAKGTAVITVTAKEDQNYNAATATVNVEVVVDISQVEITVSDVVYDGTAKKPVVNAVYGGSVLTEGTDYTLTYGQNIDAGEYPIMINGIGAFKGSVQRTYNIQKAEQVISAEDMELLPYETAAAKVNGALGELSYATDAPEVATVAEDGTVTAVAKGTATITVNAASTANYKAGSTTFIVDVTTYDLASEQCAAELAETSFVYTGDEKKPGVSYVKFGDVTLTEGTDYTVSYDDNVNPGTGSVTISGNDKTTTGTKTLSFTIGKGIQPLAVAQDHMTIVIGNTDQIEVSGNVNALTFTSSDENVATVDEYGEVTAVAEGNAVITVTAAESAIYGGASLTVEVEVKGNLQPQEIDCDTSTPVVAAKTKAYTVTGAQGELTFEISDTTVATVASVSGAKVTVKGIKPGFAKLIVKAAAAEGFEATEKEFDITVVPGAPKQVRATNLAGGMKLTWDKAEGAKRYYVYRGDYLIKDTSKLECGDNEVKTANLQKFTYRVVAYAEVDGVELVSTESRTTTYYRVMTVGVKKLTNPSSGKLVVTYDTNPKATGYVVRYSNNADMSDAKTKTVMGANTNSFTITGVKKGKTFYVQVRTFVRKPTDSGGTFDYFSTYSTIKNIKITK